LERICDRQEKIVNSKFDQIRGSSSKLAAACRWLFDDHVCVVLHVYRNVRLLALTALTATSGGCSYIGGCPGRLSHGGMILAACYGVLTTVMEPYDLATMWTVMTWTVMLPLCVNIYTGGSDPTGAHSARSLATVLSPLLQAGKRFSDFLNGETIDDENLDIIYTDYD
jgi:hypothetical protein